MSEDYSPYAMAADMVAKRDARIAALEAELAEAKALLAYARPYVEGIHSTNSAPYMDGSAYPGWLDEPRTAAKKKPAAWWDELADIKARLREVQP